LDPVSLDLQDPEGLHTSYDLNTAQFSNAIPNAFVSVASNVELVVIPLVSGEFNLAVSDVPGAARGAAVVLANGQSQTIPLTQPLRDGQREFVINVGGSAQQQASPPPGSSHNSVPEQDSAQSAETNSSTTTAASGGATSGAHSSTSTTTTIESGASGPWALAITPATPDGVTAPPALMQLLMEIVRRFRAAVSAARVEVPKAPAIDQPVSANAKPTAVPPVFTESTPVAGSLLTVDVQNAPPAGKPLSSAEANRPLVHVAAGRNLALIAALNFAGVQSWLRWQGVRRGPRRRGRTRRAGNEGTR
jgi:hypothetical protein